MTTVYKLGGSLLVRPDLPTLLHRIIGSARGGSILVVGGGATTDVVRAWDDLHGLGDQASHKLAITSLQLTAALVVQLFDGAVSCDSRESVARAWSNGRVPVLDIRAFLAAEEQSTVANSHLPRLPATWETTSDSIAAWIAIRWPADELVVVKSCSATGAGVGVELDWARAADQGLVDPLFPRISVGIPSVRWIDASSPS